MARRKYTLMKKCKADGCKETSYHEYDRKSDYSEAYSDYAKRGWLCYEHATPNISIEDITCSISEAEKLIGTKFMAWNEFTQNRYYAGIRTVTRIDLPNISYSTPRGWKLGMMMVYSHQDSDVKSGEYWQGLGVFKSCGKTRQDAINEALRLADKCKIAFDNDNSYHRNYRLLDEEKDWRRIAKELEDVPDVLIVEK